MDLHRLGWNQFFEDEFILIKTSGDFVGRIILAQGSGYTIIDEEGVRKAKLSGVLRNSIKKRNQYPVVGDWVVNFKSDNSEKAFIKAVLPRKSSFMRKLPISGGRKYKKGTISGGVIEEQVICSNIDTVFIVSGLDQDFDIHRIERYITLVYGSSSSPVILLNKSDICESTPEYINSVKKIALDIPVYAVSATTGIGMECINSYLGFGKTVVFLGSSGVGKSTIINKLLGEDRQQTNRVSDATGKGKHTTVKAELISHPNGAMIIDTPGLRELQLWGSIDDLNCSYSDIYELSLKCKYKNCAHEVEPDCAVKNAINSGLISQDRLESYQKQLSELTRLNQQQVDYAKSSSKKERLRLKQEIFRFQSRH